MELIQLTEKTYYTDTPSMTGMHSVIGLYKLSDTKVVLIDTGDHPKKAKELLDIITQRGWTVEAVINTHCHADHIAGNAFLQEQTGCKIYASDKDAWWIRHTDMCPSFDFGGFPFREITNSFFIAKRSNCSAIEDVKFEGLEIINLPGHSEGSIGIMTDDGVLFVGDAVCGREMIENSKFVYNFDIKILLESFEKLEGISAKWYLPSHSEPVQDIKELCKINRDKVFELLNFVWELCEQPVSVDELICAAFQKAEMSMNTSQYVLIGCILRNHLSYLRNTKKIRPTTKDNMVRWQSVIEKQ